MKRLARILAAAVLIVPVAHAVNCNWQTVPTNINFGTYSVFGGAVTGNSTFTIKCTPPAVGVVTLSRGGSATYNPRTMSKAAPIATLDYNLYLDGATTIIWGDGTSGTQFLSFTPVPGNTILTSTIFGQIPGGLDAPAGTYNDTVQATLNWGTGIDQRFFTLQAVVLSECNVTTSPLNFGAYDPIVANAATPKDATTVVNVYCTNGTLATVSLDLGTNFTGSTRRLRTGAATYMTYDLYKDAARSTVWNTLNTNSGTSTSKLTAINGGFTVYGRIPGGQDIPAGAYSDTIQVTVNY